MIEKNRKTIARSMVHWQHIYIHTKIHTLQSQVSSRQL